MEDKTVSDSTKNSIKSSHNVELSYEIDSNDNSHDNHSKEEKQTQSNDENENLFKLIPGRTSRGRTIKKRRWS
ncbi:hypothetical protein GJ496_000357 [Pomphorhynchus laevis]|nr:hypothetical protein GJ496_000357 [Pomphorhynchus laevis]